MEVEGGKDKWAGGEQFGYEGVFPPSWEVSVESRVVEFLPTVHYHSPHPSLNAHTQISTTEQESIALPL